MFKINLKNTKGLRRGFTLLEALVATSILMVAVAAPITIAQKGLSSAVYSKDQMIASYLAQDAIEYIKNKRDEASIEDASFNWDGLADLGDCVLEAAEVLDGKDNDTNGRGCQIDTTEEIDEALNSYSNSTFLWKDSNNFYQYEDTTRSDGQTKFTRQVQIQLREVQGRLDEALVRVTVRWAPDNVIIVNTLMYNY